MVILYFSGTGNSKFIAKEFAIGMNCEAYSIEEEVDFHALISEHDQIAFSYPIYGSCVPLILRDFVAAHLEALRDKALIILSTQYFFSGDGARVFTDLLKDIPYRVIYAEHFNMPNNICNLFFFPIANDEKIIKQLEKNRMKIKRVCEDIINHVTLRRGFNPISECLGFVTQRSYFPAGEKRAIKDVRIEDTCVLCGLCIETCPTKNLFKAEGRIQGLGKCTLCYRCVNLCPQKSITVLIHAKVLKQYRFFLNQ